ncbi:MAG TPA: anti-sigma factor [Gaiellaceae bacterium]|nr:anti-sigma factor [Gaiellaceae bacterium]
MKEPPDLRDLVGGELSPEELERLRAVDTLLRRVPAPPHDVPASLTAAVAEVPLTPRRGQRGRRVALALAFAAVLVAVSFGIGHWSGSRFDAAYSVQMAPTTNAPRAQAVVQVGERDEDSGNVELLLDVSGLPKLDPGENYALWLERDGEWAATCGYFAVGEEQTSVRMTVSYDFFDFDAWVISAVERSDEHTPMLEATIPPAS